MGFWIFAHLDESQSGPIQYRANTAYSFFELRFTESIGHLEGNGWPGVFFQAAAKMCGGLFGWDPWFSIALVGIVVAVYTIGGGLEAVVLTDVVQCVALFVGGLTLAGIGLHRVGGFGGLQQNLRAQGVRTEHHLKLLMPVDLKDGAGQPTGYPWSGILLGLGFVLSPAYWLGNQAIVQRTLGAKDEWSARAAMIFGALLKTLVPLAFVLPGLLAIALWGDRAVTDANQIYPQLINELLPTGLRGVLYAAFLAALMSSVDSYANSAATIVCRDLYRRFLRPDESDAHYLKVGRTVSLGVIALGIAMVPVVSAYQTIYDAFQTFLSFFQGPSLALLLCGLLWKRASPTGGLSALLIGIFGAICMHLFSDIHYLHMAWWSFVLALAVLIAVSLVTKPLAAEQLEALMVKSPGAGK